MMQNVLLFCLFGITAVTCLEKAYYLEDYCGKMTVINIDSPIQFLLSRSNKTTTTSCRSFVNLETKQNASFLLNFSSFNLTAAEANGYCTKHFLQIDGVEGNQPLQRMCDYVKPDIHVQYVLSYDQGGDKSLYYFRTVLLSEYNFINFTISPVTYADTEGHCPLLMGQRNATVNTFRCESNNLCIPALYRCDDVRNCEDGSDEVDCIGTTVSPLQNGTLVHVNPNELAGDGKGNSKAPHIIIGVTGGLIIILLVAAVALFLIRRKLQYRGVSTQEEINPPAKVDQDPPTDTTV